VLLGATNHAEECAHHVAPIVPRAVVSQQLVCRSSRAGIRPPPTGPTTNALWSPRAPAPCCPPVSASRWRGGLRIHTQQPDATSGARLAPQARTAPVNERRREGMEGPPQTAAAASCAAQPP
jgi:hypothetical protein